MNRNIIIVYYRNKVVYNDVAGGDHYTKVIINNCAV